MPTIINGNTGVDQVTNNTLVVADAKSGEPVGFQKMQLFAAKATTSGTSIDFSPTDGTGIPSWAKKITLVFGTVSLSGTTQLLVQLGAGSLETTSYSSFGTLSDSTATASSSTAGFIIRSTAATNSLSLNMELINISGNIWISSHVGTNGQTGAVHGGGSKTLGGLIDRIRITTVNGTDTFDAGSISILVEGYE